MEDRKEEAAVAKSWSGHELNLLKGQRGTAIFLQYWKKGKQHGLAIDSN